MFPACHAYNCIIAINGYDKDAVMCNTMFIGDGEKSRVLEIAKAVDMFKTVSVEHGADLCADCKLYENLVTYLNNKAFSFGLEWGRHYGELRNASPRSMRVVCACGETFKGWYEFACHLINLAEGE